MAGKDKEKQHKMVLEKAKELEDKWLAAQSYTGDYDLDEIQKLLSERTHEGKPVETYVVADPEEAMKLLQDMAKANPEAKDAISNAYQCIWDFYLMAFYSCAYGAASSLIKDPIEFATYDFLPAFKAGLGFLINLGSVAIGIARPEAYRDGELRLHNDKGPSIRWGSWETYYWHGVEIPKEWILDKASIDPKIALTDENVERRRAVAEIVGWDRVLEVAEAKELCEDERGKLLQLELDGVTRRFVTFTCPSTGRKYAHCVPEECKTPTEAVAWMWEETPETFHPEVET